MSIESIKSRRNQYEKILEDWSIHELIGSGSGGKTGVFRITKNQEFEEIGALKVVNIIEIDGSFDKIHKEVRQGYELERGDLLKEAIREVDTMYKLKDCPHVMRYLDRKVYNWESDSQFGCDLLIRMDYRQTIWRLAEKRSLDEAAIIQIGIDICKALVECQKHNIIHRDIKPQNIFAVDSLDHYLLGDFGIARIVKDAYKATTHKGTDWYAAPEQYYAGKNGYDGRVDIYSLGLTLYVLLNKNNIPFKTREISWTTANQQRLRGDAPLPPPCEASDELSKIILKACAYHRENRYQSAQEFLDKLEELKWERADFHKHRKDFQDELQGLGESSNTGEISKDIETDKSTRDIKPGDELNPLDSDKNEDTIQQRFAAMVDQASREGDVVALCELGDCYMYGRGVPKDGVKALKCFSEAAEYHRFRPAELRLALCYMKGIGGCLNERLASHWLSAHGWGENRIDASVAYELANCYATGQGVQQNDFAAVRWYRNAAEQGDAESQYNLGSCYLKGKGISKNEEEAVRWLTKAARQGHGLAQQVLGLCYMTGSGIQKDVSIAAEWLIKAEVQGIYVGMDIDRCYLEMFESVKSNTSAIVESPVHGEVTEVNCKKGQMVQAGNVLAVLKTADTKTVEITAPVSGTIEVIAAYTNRHIWPGAFLAAIEESTKEIIDIEIRPIAANAKESQEPSEITNRDDYHTEDFMIEGGVLIKYCGHDENVVLPEEIVEIGEGAFKDCPQLKSISIGEGVVKIGNRAFVFCIGLTSVAIPNSVTYIGESAFAFCIGLTSVAIPNSVTYIGESAFASCIGLTSVAIPNSVTYIGVAAFGQCSYLTSINVASGNSEYASLYGVLFNSNQTLLHTYPSGKREVSYHIPSSVTSIGKYAFYDCEHLTSVAIPNSITHIEDYAFANCSSLKIYYGGSRKQWLQITVNRANNRLLTNDTIHYNSTDTV